MIFSTASIRKAVSLTASAAALLLSSDHHSVEAAPIVAAWMTPQERRFVASVSPDTFLGYRLSQASNVTLFMENLQQERALHPTPSGSGGGCASGSSIAQKQLVYLQFDPISPTYPIDLYSMTDGGAFCRTEQVPRRRYTEEQKEAIQARLEADYAFLNDSFVFTTEPPHPLQGAYSTLRFYHEFSLFDVYDRTRFELGVENCSVALEDASTLERIRVGILGGNAENIDFLNTNKADMAVLDILDHIHTELMLDPTGVGLSNYLQIPMTSVDVEDFVNRLIIHGGANFAAHELGHLAGLRHHDAFGPIGSPRVTNLEEYYNHVLTTPALGGIAALTSLYTRDTFFSERSATKLYLSLHATPLSEDQVQDGGRPMELEIVHVPNTLRSGVNSDNTTTTTPTFPIGVGIISGSLSSVVDTDRFLFTLEEGTFLNVEVISISDTKFLRWIDPYVKLYYYYDESYPPHHSSSDNNNNNKTELVYEDVDLESPDVWFNNFPIQVTGTYEIEVGDNNYVFGDGGVGGGDYALYIHTGGFPLVTDEPPIVLESWDYICDDDDDSQMMGGGKIHCFSHGDEEDWHYHNKCFGSQEEIDAYASKNDHQYIGRGCCEEQQKGSSNHVFDPSLEVKADKETEEYCRTFLPEEEEEEEEEEVTLRNRRRGLLRQHK